MTSIYWLFILLSASGMLTKSVDLNNCCPQPMHRRCPGAFYVLGASKSYVSCVAIIFYDAASLSAYGSVKRVTVYHLEVGEGRCGGRREIPVLLFHFKFRSKRYSDFT